VQHGKQAGGSAAAVPPLVIPSISRNTTPAMLAIAACSRMHSASAIGDSIGQH